MTPPPNDPRGALITKARACCERLAQGDRDLLDEFIGKYANSLLALLTAEREYERQRRSLERLLELQTVTLERKAAAEDDAERRKVCGHPVMTPGCPDCGYSAFIVSPPPRCETEPVLIVTGNRVDTAPTVPKGKANKGIAL